MAGHRSDRLQYIMVSTVWLALGILAAVYGFVVIAAVFIVMSLIWFPWERWNS